MHTHLPATISKIVSTTQSLQGHSCEAHHVCGTVVSVGIVVCLCKDQMMIEGEEQSAITVYWVNDGIDRCNVSFLCSHLKKDVNPYTKALAQVLEMYDNSSISTAKHCKYNENWLLSCHNIKQLQLSSCCAMPSNWHHGGNCWNYCI